MKLKMKILTLIGGLLILVFALNLGVAFANNPEESNDGIATARDTNDGITGTSAAGGGGGRHGLDASDGANENGDLTSSGPDARNPICGNHPVE